MPSPSVSLPKGEGSKPSAWVKPLSLRERGGGKGFAVLCLVHRRCITTAHALTLGPSPKGEGGKSSAWVKPLSLRERGGGEGFAVLCLVHRRCIATAHALTLGPSPRGRGMQIKRVVYAPLPPG